eukprot:CAMPEP_0195512552 /NCGR_PEP_ID=MMETSP0794_2-20130614/4474_1 /TAXON_ID=515487 /ORGANISM="Stephanopyxis turris, Strain CCMP 815" /LENGTH=207 /DNA_ID=CAMNT_0040640359 /DNA_START=338 /DNA_END=962 /DNA_ORIENTATION=-
MKIGETFPEMEEEAESMKKDEEVHSVNWVERLFQRSLWMRNTEHFYNDIVNQVHPDQKIKSNSRKLSSCFTTCFSNGGCDVECPLCIENICVAEQRSGDNRDSCDHECSLSSPTSSCGGNCNECRAHQVQGVRLDYGRCVDPGSIDRSKCGGDVTNMNHLAPVVVNATYVVMNRINGNVLSKNLVPDVDIFVKLVMIYVAELAINAV